MGCNAALAQKIRLPHFNGWRKTLMKGTRVILLAAGQGSRLQEILGGRPKPLIDYGGEPLIHRVIRQCNEVGFTDISVVIGYRGEDVSSSIQSYFPATHFIYNHRFREDKNIYSLICGLQGSDAPALILEGDVAFSDMAALRLREGVAPGESYWTSCGRFKEHQQGGILRTADGQPNITEILYASFEERYRHYFKNLGIVFCGAGEMPRFRQLLEEYSERTLDEYYMTPWAEHLDELPAKLIDLGESGGLSFNTVEEYEYALRLVPPAKAAPASSRKIELVDIQELRHIEDFDPQRCAWLAEKIRTDGVWTAPLLVDSDHGLVMDGQHRMEAALMLGLKRVPIIRFSYSEVTVWSLRPEADVVTVDEIIRRGLEGNIYPYKTAKHQFPEQIPECSFTLKSLR